MLQRARDSSLAKQPDIKIIFEMPFPCTFGWFSSLVSENTRILQSDAEPQLTLADHVFKVKFALHSKLSMSANLERP